MTEKTIVLPPNPGGNGADANYRLTVMVSKRRYLSYLRNRWWVVMVCMALAIGAIVTYETVRPETYVSGALLYVTLGPQLGSSIFAEPKDDYATQIELLKGSRLRREAEQSLGSEMAGKIKGPIAVDVYRPMGASILQIRVTSGDANLSQKFLQALIDQYLEFKKKTRLSTSEDLVAKLNDALSVREDALKTNQDRWAEFQKSNNIPVVQEDAKSEGAYLTELKMQLRRLTLEKRLLEEGLLPEPVAALTNTAVLEASTNLLATTTNALPTAMTTPSLFFLMANDTDLKNARIDLNIRKHEREKLVADHGEAAGRPLDKELQRLENRVAELEKTDAALRQETLREYEKRLAAIKDSIPAVENSVKTDNDLLYQGQLINDEKNRQQASYDNLSGMIKNVDFSKNMEQERITLLEPPSPGTPSPRSLPVRVAMAGVGGLFLALGIVFVWHLVDDRLISVHDVKDQFGEPVLGLLPRVRVAKSKPFGALLESGDNRAGYLESYRHLRSALLLSSFGQGRPQTVLFTGAVPAEGKTTIAINLARLLAQSGMDVVLVDTDVRGGHIHQMLGKAEGPGFLDFLRGQAEASAIIYSTDVPGLSFVPVGAAGGETDGILTHANLEDLMKELKTGRDFVILDSAPLLSADDASILVPYADAVILVVRPFYTRSRQTRRALEMLYQRQTKQVALVLNRASADDLAGQYYADKRKSTAAKNGKA